MREPISRWYDAGGLRLHYQDWGAGPRKLPVVMVHGGRDHCGAWEEVITRLPPEFGVVAPDLRGHGDSDWAPGSAYTPWEYASDLDALVRALGATQPVVLAGHSLGGAIALQYAGVRPDRVAAVLVIEPFGLGRGVDAERALYGGVSQDVIKVTPTEARIPGPDRLVAYLDALADFEERAMPSYATIHEAVERMKAANPRVLPEVVERIARAAVRQLQDGRFVWKFDNRVRVHSPYGFSIEEASELWRRIAAPVLIVNGAESRPGDARQSDGFEAFFRDVEVTSVAGASHFVHVEQPGEVARLLSEFVSTHVGAPG